VPARSLLLSSRDSTTNADRRRAWVCGLFLVALTAAVYSRVVTFGFVNFDDPEYVVNNSRVHEGLHLDNVAWALTTNYFANWHPLTWLSYMLDCELFGPRPGPMHAVNLLIHVVDSVLLFWVLRRMTAAMGSSFVVALLFALHPLHVESVAWISERKDVLSTLFLLLAIGAYQAYVERPTWSRYLAVAALFALGLAAKPMLVTLPCLLLLLDYWPLNRLSAAGVATANFNTANFDTASIRRQAGRLVVEKIPLFGLAALSAVMTIRAQSAAEAMSDLEVVPLGMRLANAAVSYVTYLLNTIWPANLAIFYPHPVASSRDATALAEFYFRAVVSACALAAITAAVVVWGRRRRYLVVGWFWYLGALVPVIGILQAGGQSLADRYTYVPLIGIFIMAAWGVPDLLERVAARRWWLSGAAAAAVAGCSVLTWIQIGHWRDSITLFSHAVAVTTDNWLAEQNLAAALELAGRHEEAVAVLERRRQNGASAPELDNLLAMSYYNLGQEYEQAGRTAEAARAFARVIEVRPGDAKAHNSLGLLLFEAGRGDAAIAEFRAAIEHDAKCTEARANLGAALCQSGRMEEGLGELRRCVAEDPRFVPGRVNLGLGLAQVGRREEAARQFEEALAIDPTNDAVREHLARAVATAEPPK
jgi:tetratricopeptide (TPR) repeat protein